MGMLTWTSTGPRALSGEHGVRGTGKGEDEKRLGCIDIASVASALAFSGDPGLCTPSEIPLAALRCVASACVFLVIPNETE